MRAITLTRALALLSFFALSFFFMMPATKAGVSSVLTEDFSGLPCVRLPRSNVFQSALRREEKDWQKKHRWLRLRDLSRWTAAHGALVAAMSEQRMKHFERVVRCTAAAEEIGTEPAMREGTRLVLYYESSVTKRAALPDRLAQTGAETAAERVSYFQAVRSGERKTRRTIREEHRERMEARVLLP